MNALLLPRCFWSPPLIPHCVLLNPICAPAINPTNCWLLSVKTHRRLWFSRYSHLHLHGLLSGAPRRQDTKRTLDMQESCIITTYTFLLNCTCFLHGSGTTDSFSCSQTWTWCHVLLLIYLWRMWWVMRGASPSQRASTGKNHSFSSFSPLSKA